MSTSDVDAQGCLVALEKIITDEEVQYAADITLEDFVEDLAMSMDITTQEADDARANIQAHLSHGVSNV
jgi:hypothetical protein